MKTKKVYRVLIVIFTASAVIFGFYLGSGNDHKSAALDGSIDPGNYTGSINNNPVSDLLGAWTLGAPPITPRIAGVGVSFQRNDTGWIFTCCGGTDYASTLTRSNERYNINTNAWDTLTPHPVTREYLGGARISHYMYTIAGMSNSYFSSEDKLCYRYDIYANTWSQVSDITPESSQGIAGNRAVGYQDSLIYCAGGFNAGSSNAISSVYLYNANTNTWRIATSLPAVRCMGAFSIAGDTLVYVGGGTSYFSGYNTTVYKGLISQTDRATIIWSTTISYPGVNNFRYNGEPWFSKGIIVTGGTNSTFGSSTECYVFSPGNNVWTQQPSSQHAIGSTQSGTVMFSLGLMKLVCASGEQYPITPYAAPYTQIYTDTGIGGPFPHAYPWCEGFTQSTFPPQDWTITGGTANYWKRNASVSGYGLGTGSAYYNCWSAPSGENEDFKTFTFTPTNYQPDSLGFDFAYAPYPAAPPYVQDSLIVSASTNAGNSWIVIARMGPLQLQTAPPQNSQFIPAVNQWGKKRIAFPLGTNKVTFTGKSAYGNDIYIDSVCGIEPGGIKKNSNEIPSTYLLSQNYPNPFNPTTRIKFDISPLTKGGFVRLSIYDILGREIDVLINEQLKPGSYEVEWDGSNFSSGIYFYRLESGTFTETKKMLMIK
jgi:hypothetical protein